MRTISNRQAFGEKSRPSGWGLVCRLLREEGGEDIVEYALLTAFIGLAGLTTWSAMENGLGNAYQGFTNGLYGLWEPPPPDSAPSAGGP